MKLSFLVFVITIAAWALYKNLEYLKGHAEKKPELVLRRLGNTNVFYYTAV